MARTRTANSAPVITSLRECGEMGLTTRRGLRARGCRVRWLRASLRASPCPRDRPNCSAIHESRLDRVNARIAAAGAGLSRKPVSRFRRLIIAAARSATDS